MSSAKIQIGYDGEALKDGEMDVRELAPALLAVGDLLQEAHALLNDGRGRLTTHVRSDFKNACFEVNLKLVQDIAEQISFALEHCKHWGAPEIAKFIGLSAGTAASGLSLIAFLKKLKNRKIKSSTVIQSGNIRIETDVDYESIEVSPQVIRLAKNQRVRASLRAVFKPFEKIGFSAFYAKDQGREIERVTKEEAQYFDVPASPEQELSDSTRKMAVHLIEISFEEGLKWKLSDGENRFNVAVLDKAFQGAIDAGKKFAKDDILVVKLRTKQASVGDKIKVEHELVEVLEHIPAEQQTDLPLLPDQPTQESNSEIDQT